MRWASAVGEGTALAAAFEAAAADIRAQLVGQAPDLVLAFVSPAYAGDYERLPGLVQRALGDGLLVGCSAGGVIGGGRELEQKPAVSLTAAVLPGVTLEAFHLDHAARAESATGMGIGQAAGALADPGVSPPQFLLLADPFTFNAEPLLRGLDVAYPDSVKLGGLASGGREPGENVLYLRSQIHRSGLAGVALQGNLVLDTLVAQGCRPIGDPLFVTACRGNRLLGLDGQPPVMMLSAIYEQLDANDQELLRSALFLGVAMPGARERYRHGDFLIRNLLGSDADSGALIVGTTLQDNSVVQFHVRDAHSSAEDLDALLKPYAGLPVAERPCGSLLFSCVGRGEGLYGVPDHDSQKLRQHLGNIPVGGFFCNGEIGPVQGTTFLHGYTSAFGLFRPRQV
jgi:small ligand-binding sensory domain FIST